MSSQVYYKRITIPSGAAHPTGWVSLSEYGLGWMAVVGVVVPTTFDATHIAFHALTDTQTEEIVRNPDDGSLVKVVTGTSGGHFPIALGQLSGMASIRPVSVNVTTGVEVAVAADRVIKMVLRTVA